MVEWIGMFVSVILLLLFSAEYGFYVCLSNCNLEPQVD
jgi:hypothetical protein